MADDLPMPPERSVVVIYNMPRLLYLVPKSCRRDPDIPPLVQHLAERVGPERQGRRAAVRGPAMQQSDQQASPPSGPRPVLAGAGTRSQSDLDRGDRRLEQALRSCSSGCRQAFLHVGHNLFGVQACGSGDFTKPIRSPMVHRRCSLRWVQRYLRAYIS
jgi:hypothetical protein